MPLIPRYSITQTSTHVHIEVSIPHVRVSPAKLELVIVDGTELHLYAPPTYLLKLNLPDRVVDENGVEESLTCAVTDSDAAPNNSAAENADENDNIDDDAGVPAPTHRHLWTSDDLPKMQYNPEKNHGTLVIILRKEEERFWQDLDLLGLLQQPMMPRQDVDRTPSTTPPVTVIREQGDLEKGEEFDEYNTTSVMEDLLSINRNRPKYGLFQQFSNVFRDYAREGLVHEMLECPNPDEVTANNNIEGCDSNNHTEEQNRRQLRLQTENHKFDSDRYLNDLHAEEEEDIIFDTAMKMVPHWMEDADDDIASLNYSIGLVETITDHMTKLSTSSDDNNSIFFTTEESHLLATLPPQHKNTPLQLSTEQRRSAFLTLIDILFAYAYDHRTTDGDPTVESSWTVMILSSSLSWLDNFNPPYDTIVDILRWNIRRSLIYPYLRVYSLSRKVIDDVCRIIIGGRRRILRCLLQVHRIMEKSESHYLFNKLYIGPLIGWTQQCKEIMVSEFGKELLMITKHDVAIGKGNLGLDLVELENAYLESDGSDDDDDDDDDDDN